MANFNFNKVILGGRLTADPELKNLPTGTAVCESSIAVTRARAKDGENPITDFVRIVAFSKTAEFLCRYFHKGECLCVVGRIQTRNYEDRNGNKVYVTEVVVDEVQFVESKSKKKPQEATKPQTAQVPTQPDYAQQGVIFEEIEGDDDLPF